MTEIPETAVECSNPKCDKPLVLLTDYLAVQVKAQRSVLVSEDVPSDGQLVGDNRLYLGVKSGRGVLLRFHDFDCFDKWVNARKGLAPKIEGHYEDEIYVPEDNRSPEELVKDGELRPEMLALLNAQAATATVVEG